MENYEYNYNIYWTPYKATFYQGNFMFVRGKIKTKIPLQNITGFALGYYHFSDLNKIKKNPPAQAPNAKKVQLQVAYSPTNNPNKKKIAYMVLDMENPTCRNFMNEFYKRLPDKYIGFGPSLETAKALGFTFAKTAIIILLIIGVLTAAGVIFGIVMNK